MRIYVANDQNATVYGEYSAWMQLRRACEELGFPALGDHSIVGEPHDIRRMAEYLRLYWSQIRRVSRRAAWRKLAELCNVSILKGDNTPGTPLPSGEAHFGPVRG